jgi:hypothetical protein
VGGQQVINIVFVVLFVSRQTFAILHSRSCLSTVLCSAWKEREKYGTVCIMLRQPFFVRFQDWGHQIIITTTTTTAFAAAAEHQTPSTQHHGKKPPPQT